jgi:hypothetical protein
MLARVAGGEFMHFHLPKPLHGWRAFVGEIGIIVIGVLIALTAEQFVEHRNWEIQARSARAALTAEIRDDNLPQAYARVAIAPCLDSQLKQLQDAFDHEMDRAQFAPLARNYLPPKRTWDNEAWTAVVATGVLSHGGSQELIQWSLPYRMIVVLGPRNAAERDDRVNLKSISSLPGQLTPFERDRVTVALEHLRSDEKAMVDGSKILLATAAQAGIVMSAQQRRQALDELRPDWGKCLVEPPSRFVDPDTQSDHQFRT